MTIPQAPAPLPPLPTPPRTPPRPRAEAPSSSFPKPLNFSLNGDLTQATPTPPRGSASNSGPVNLALGPAIRNSRGAPPRSTHAADSVIRVVGAQVGDDWIALLHRWWDNHSYYPREAAQRGEDGTVQITVGVDRDGRVTDVHIDSGSGSQWLDLASLGLFRGAHLPPFPQATQKVTARCT